MKFKDEIISIQKLLLNQGILAFTPMILLCDDKEKNDIITDDIIKILHKIHNIKIESSDAILVMDIDGYIGDDTKQEIEYAKSLNKDILYYSDNIILIEDK